MLLRFPLSRDRSDDEEDNQEGPFDVLATLHSLGVINQFKMGSPKRSTTRKRGVPRGTHSAKFVSQYQCSPPSTPQSPLPPPPLKQSFMSSSSEPFELSPLKKALASYRPTVCALVLCALSLLNFSLVGRSLTANLPPYFFAANTGSDVAPGCRPERLTASLRQAIRYTQGDK
jgi:hypothetical protein